MTYFNQTFPVLAEPGFKRNIAWIVTFGLLGFGSQALAHVEYYDLNQGVQISDLTEAGKIASTAQYGNGSGTPAAVLAFNASPGPNGIGTSPIVAQLDLPLNNPSEWNLTNQSQTLVGTFTGLTYTPTASTATVDVNDVTDFGWGDGTYLTTPNLRTQNKLLGDSHKVDFFNFRLSQRSTVTITWNVDDGNGNYIDNGFTLYRGYFSFQGHDDANEKLNPKSTIFPYPRIQDALDSQSAPVDAQGIASAYRNTLTNTVDYFGQFNALGNWGQSNVAGNWANGAYIAHANAKITDFSITASDTLETLTITLDPGNYTIAASGALGAVGSGSSSSDLTNLHGHLTYSASTCTP